MPRQSAKQVQGLVLGSLSLLSTLLQMAPTLAWHKWLLVQGQGLCSLAVLGHSSRCSMLRQALVEGQEGGVLRVTPLFQARWLAGQRVLGTTLAHGWGRGCIL